MSELTEKQREDLQREIRDLDEALDEIIAARHAVASPFDKALCALEARKEALLERYEAEIAGSCEVCERLILAGERGYSYADDSGFVFCEEHSPTWAEELVQAKELVQAADDPSEYTDFLALAQSHVEAGDGDKKNCWGL